MLEELPGNIKSLRMKINLIPLRLSELSGGAFAWTIQAGDFVVGQFQLGEPVNIKATQSQTDLLSLDYLLRPAGLTDSTFTIFPLAERSASSPGTLHPPS